MSLMYNILGQKHLQELWTRWVANQQVPHAILVAGKDGFGGLALALNLSEALLCTTPLSERPQSKQIQGCGHCPSCRRVRQLTHPDLHIAFPMVSAARKKHATTARKKLGELLIENPYLPLEDFLGAFSTDNQKKTAGNITADDVKGIISNISLSSFYGGWKVQVIWHAECLDKESNKLLKLLEEPPPKTLFILLTPNANLLLTTILSRCQRFQLKPVSYGAIGESEAGFWSHSNIPSESQWNYAQGVPGNLYDNSTHNSKTEEVTRHAEELVRVLVAPPTPKRIHQLEQMMRVINKLPIALQKQILGYVAHLLGETQHIDPSIQNHLVYILSEIVQELGQSIRLSTRIMGLWLNTHRKFSI